MGVESSPKTPNAFLAAIDLDSGKYLWTSEMRAAGGQDFIVTGGYAIATAGMTGNPGRVTVVRLSDGVVVDSIEIPFGPVYLVHQGRNVVIQGGSDGEAILRLDATPEPPAPAGLPTAESAHALPIDPTVLCALRTAIVAIDARDGLSAQSELGMVPDKNGPGNALRGVAAFLVRAKAEPDQTIDLTSAPPVRVTTTATTPPDLNATIAPPPTVKRKLTTAAMSAVRVVSFDGPQGINFIVPDALGALPLTGSSAWPDGNLIYYGPRFVVSAVGTTLDAVLDIAPFLRVDPSTGDGLHLGHMELDAKHVLLSFSHMGPPTALGGDKDFVAAFDRKTGALAWKSAPLVSSVRFARQGAYIFTAGGWPGEKSYLYVLRADTGATVSKTPLPSTPFELGFSNGELIVQLDDGTAAWFTLH